MNRINLICLGVRDLAKSLAFYKAIGFRTHETADNPPIVFFDSTGTKLELYAIQGLAEDICPDNPPPLSQGGFGGITMAINFRTPAEVDSFMARAAAAGGRIAKPPQQVFWGGYSGYFQDPDGYYWEAAYGPDWNYDHQDMLLLDQGRG